MTSAAAQPAGLSGEHGRLMDSVYRGQRHIYDATRKYYLFGRDRLIDGLDMRAGESVLEVGCGTGRNLALISRRWPGAALFGLDISAEMLKSASAKLGGGAALAQGDATDFDPLSLFGRANFDRVVLSFATSMIPAWEAAVEQATACIAPGGSLHIVDFGDLSAMPTFAASMLKAWLAHFHVSPRKNLASHAAAVAAGHRLELQTYRGFADYYALLVLKDTATRVRHPIES